MRVVEERLADPAGPAVDADYARVLAAVPAVLHGEQPLGGAGAAEAGEVRRKEPAAPEAVRVLRAVGFAAEIAGLDGAGGDH